MKKILFLIIALFGITIASSQVKAETEACDPITLDVVLRNHEGDFIPNMNFEVYIQENDVDGKPKPATLIKAGKIDPSLGRGRVIFTDDSGKYAVRAYDQNKTSGSFWFYDEVNLGCGQSDEVELYLSSINIELRDTENVLIKNKEISVYNQKYDADNEPIKEKSDLVGKINTSEEGEAILYVPDGNSSIDGEGTDYYVFEFIASGGGTFVKYDNRLSAGNETKIKYIASDIKLKIKDENSLPFPAGQKVSVYKQKVDADGKKTNDVLIKELTTNSSGEVVFQNPSGTYSATLYGLKNQLLSYWDLEMKEGERTEYDLSVDGTWQTSQGVCKETSTLNISTVNISGEVLSGLKYEVYEQISDASGKVAGAEKVLFSGEMNSSGKATNIFTPYPRKKYAIKFYETNKSIGAFWFYDEIQFLCGQNLELKKVFPTLNVVLRNTDMSLVKNKKFSIYTQKTDVDGFSVKEKKDLVASSFITTEEGRARLHLSTDSVYVLEVIGENSKTYYEYGIKINNDSDTNLDYIFSDIIIKFLEGNGKAAPNMSVSIFSETKNASGNYTLGKLELTQISDKDGAVRFTLPAGYYGVSVKDSLKKDVIFYHIKVKNKKRTEKTIKMNMGRLSVLNSRAQLVPNSTVKIFELKENEKGEFYRGILLGTQKTAGTGFIDLRLNPGPYLFVYSDKTTEYGKTEYIENNKLEEIKISISAAGIVRETDKYALVKPPKEITMGEKLSGKILLQVESRGEAWYVDTISKKRYYLRDGASAYEMMRKFGLGISNNDLSKIAIGLDDRFNESDYDGDYVSDKTEEAIGTDMYKYDSDGDKYNDGQEIKNGFNPRGTGTLPIDQKITDRLKGKILIQTEAKGQAWYLNPSNGKRYYMKDGESAYEIMRFLSLGISDDNLEEIEIGN